MAAVISKTQVIKNLYSKLKPVQKEMFQNFYKCQSRKVVAHSARRLGKTYFLCVLSIITAVHKDNAQIRFASSTQKAVRKMIFPIMKEIFSSLPVKYKGRWNSIEGAFLFKNGSMIHVAGVNNQNADSLRGTAADLFVIDEAAFVDELSYLVDSVAIPQLMTVTGAKLIMASSSPLSPAHEFVSYIQETRQSGGYTSYDITQGGYPDSLVEEFLREAGGRNSTTARREYFNELITDDQLAVIPEWKKEYIQEIQRPETFSHLHKYRAMDIGVRDKTAIIFGYYNFSTSKLVIEEEWSVSGQDTTTLNITKALKEKTQVLGYNNFYRSIADNNNIILLQDLSSQYEEHFSPTNKDTLIAMVNEVREFVGQGRLIIHPRCKELAGCLEFAVYQDNKRKEFGRSRQYGHYDMLASLIYLIRNLDQQTNPIPNTFNTTFNSFIPFQENESESAIKKLFNF